jgi:hypothetical protein
MAGFHLGVWLLRSGGYRSASQVRLVPEVDVVLVALCVPLLLIGFLLTMEQAEAALFQRSGRAQRFTDPRVAGRRGPGGTS